jgi:transposase
MMLDQSTRQAILRLREQAHGSRAIARALGISRGAVRQVLADNVAEVPRLARLEKAEPHRADILELLGACKGNLVRVHQELVGRGAGLSYQALTAFCRRHGIGHLPPKPAGQYHFEPGQEMQHDTSPVDITIDGVTKRVQVASAVLCYSRMIFMAVFPTFNRFLCKVFLTDAVRYFEGTAKICMIDNTHVVVLHGTGKDMVPVPEMAAFSERLGFEFAAHEKGHANRSARVEGHFNFIQKNFIPGRTFASWEDLNQQARTWCDTTNVAFNRRWHASRRELFATERPHLVALPLWVPEVYALHQRHVDLEGYVSVHRNRYSVPYQLIGRELEVRETKDRIEVYQGPREVASHAKVVESMDARVTDPSHRPPRGEGRKARSACRPEEAELQERMPELSGYVRALKERRSLLALRGLLRLVREYPAGPVLKAVRLAEHYGLYDIERLERLVLRHIAGDYYFPREDGDGEPEDQDEG